MTHFHTIKTVLADAKKAGHVVTRFAGQINGKTAFQIAGRPWALYSKSGLISVLQLYA